MSKRATTAAIGAVFIVAPFVLGHPVRDLRDWFGADQWKPVQAKVLEVSEKRVDSSRTGQTELEVRYAYSYDGLPRENASRASHGAFPRTPVAGDMVTVRVNPRDPRRALFSPGWDLMQEIIMWWGLIVLGVGALGWAFFSKPSEE